ncbi:MAG: hypothetical protein GX240_01635 [Candidatus Atribacteria bacterium]|nr:hypothetical protein [Candidatus Atribacteria bacterium]
MIVRQAEEILYSAISKMREIIREQPEKYFATDQFISHKNRKHITKYEVRKCGEIP